MKIISLPESEKSLVRKAMQQDRLAQKKLFDQYASPMLSVCRQYIKDLHYAEDVMIIGFTKAFKALSEFDPERSLGAWIRQIMVYESISFLRKRNQDFKEISEDLYLSDQNLIETHSELDTIQFYIDQLPEGYKTVFLLYAVEGYKHHEIAQMLDISEGTSKSQLHKAREILKTQLSHLTENQSVSYGR